MIIIAQVVVALFAIVIVLLSLWGIVFSDRLMGMVRSVMDKSWGMPFAIVVRIILGVALLLAASVSKYPLLFKVLGWLALIAAAALPIIGRQRLITLLNWFQSLPDWVIRLWLIAGVMFGMLLLYGISGAIG